MMYRLIYVSETSKHIDAKMISSIIGSASKNNSPAGVSGLLVYRNEFFIQLLEGERKDVTRLFNKIFADERHKNVEIILAKNIKERFYYNWTLGMIPLSASSIDDLDDHLQVPFHSLNSDTAEEFMKAIAKQSKKVAHFGTAS